ncbi:MAG: translation initiation factor IF-3 [Acidimicrobiia bacterium]|nr:translation initiation factor IF-3 [Acidimicrobiia bacterium]
MFNTGRHGAAPRAALFYGRAHTRGRNGGVAIANEPRVNDRIRVREVRLVDPNGGQVGIKSIEEARWLADQLGLDLVEVAPDARPPVVRMMDYGKFKYEQSVRARESRKKQTKTVIKEVQLRPKIGTADFEVKRRRAEKFLRHGDKVKVTMRFRGREVTHPELGMDLLQQMSREVDPWGAVEQAPRLDGRQMTMVLAPTRYALDHDDDAVPSEEESAAPSDGNVSDDGPAAVKTPSDDSEE